MGESKEKDKKKGKLDKEILKNFSESECKRELFLVLGKNNSLWINPIRKIEPLKRPPRKSEFLLTKGHIYENEIYDVLMKLPITKFKLSEKNTITGKQLEEKILEQYYSILQSSSVPYLFLLEHQYNTPNSFLDDLLPPKNKGDLPAIEVSEFRPDIIVIQNLSESEESDIYKELLPGGIIRKIPQSELKTRYSISIIDIKRTDEEKIGKKHYIEIINYLWTISYFIGEMELDDKFFVNIASNGIFPNRENIKITTLLDLYQNVVEIRWNEGYKIFSRIMNQIKDLWALAPCSINDIPLNIQPNCGFCTFLEDCKNTLGYGEKAPKDWSLKLIPYTSRSIVQQLQSKGFRTIGDVAKNIDKIPIGSTPEPLYPEIPLIELKARAIINKKTIIPSINHAHSCAIPKFSPMSIIIDFETDISNDFVFGAAINFFISIRQTSAIKYAAVFYRWVEIWKNALTKNELPLEIKVQLDDFLSYEIPLETVENYLHCIKVLKDIQFAMPNDQITINNPGKDDSSFTTKEPMVKYEFILINKEDSKKGESEFTQQLIKQLNAILNFSNIMEEFISISETFITKKGKEKEIVYRPITSIFYWHQDQLKHIQEMLERNLPDIISNPSSWNDFSEILSWLNPADSEVTHPFQHKKLFDLQKFFETIIGIPVVINYTWHEIITTDLPKYYIDKKFWIPHYNYMDFRIWYDYLESKNSKEPKVKANEIPLLNGLKYQILRKARSISILRRNYQNKGRSAISKNSYPMKAREYEKQLLPKDFHPISYVWYIYSRLEGTMDELEVEFYRIMFPEYSIGKLAAAKVSKLTQDIISIPSKRSKSKFKTSYIYHFNLTDLSSNMKISIGNYVYLIPEEKRDMSMGFGSMPWKIIIEDMYWDATINGYKVETSPTTNDLFNLCNMECAVKHDHTVWYLYPTTIDAWSNKLYSNKGLLNRKNFGRSWLGARLSYLWNIRANPDLLWPINWIFNSSEIYLFAPALIYLLSHLITPTTKLLTDINPPPDTSQTIAITKSLNNIIYGIQGPPGTGKSQTIAALVDEYIHRKKVSYPNKQLKILITAFSYAAIRVIIKKIRESRTLSGGLTKAAQVQMIFLRSNYQNPIEDVVGLPHVDDLVRDGSAWRFNHQKNVVTLKKTLENQINGDVIIFGNAHQLFHLIERVKDDFAFDLIVVDESSQLPTDNFMSSLQFIKDFQFKIEVVNGEKTNKGLNGSKIASNKINNIEEIENMAITSYVDPIEALKLTHSKLREETENNNNISNGTNTGNMDTPENLDSSRHISNLNCEDLTKIIIVGDFNQLPPVQPLDPPKKLEKILGSLFSYYVQDHLVPNSQLQTNYRSNKEIVEFTSCLGIYSNLHPSSKNANLTLAGSISNVKTDWIRKILDPEIITISLIHNRQFEIAISPLEAEIVSQVAIGFYEMIAPSTKEDERNFWTKQIGIVAPHNAQGRLIIHKIYDQISSLSPLLELKELMDLLKNTIYSVEKFQGSDRDFIIASIGLSDKDQLSAEEEFIYDLNRFNVLTSRAKSKIIFVCSQSYLDFIPNDPKIMKSAEKIRMYSLEYCNRMEHIYLQNENQAMEEIIYRWRDKAILKKNYQSSPKGEENMKVSMVNDEISIEYHENSDFFPVSKSIPVNLINNQKKDDNQIIKMTFALKDFQILKEYIPLNNSIKLKYMKLRRNSQNNDPLILQKDGSLDSNNAGNAVIDENFDTNEDKENEDDDLF
jgi:AAA domain-containing protein